MSRIKLRLFAAATMLCASALFATGVFAPMPVAAQAQVPPLEFYGELPTIEDAVISPTNLADKADAPILLIHGRDDTVVEYEQSVLMEDALEDAGKSVELVALDGEDHFLSQPATRKAMLKAAVEFVQRHNPPK